MFYHWLAPLGKQYIIFNLFNYISFRAAGATVFLFAKLAPPLCRLQKWLLSHGFSMRPGPKGNGPRQRPSLYDLSAPIDMPRS